MLRKFDVGILERCAIDHRETEAIKQVIEALDWTKAVEQFHAAADLPDRFVAGVVSPDEWQLRAELLREEKAELDSAMVNEDLVEIADAIGDLIFVLIGTALYYGIDVRAVMQEVNRTNLAKFVDGKAIRREDGKILKPHGWTPPDIAKAIGIE